MNPKIKLILFTILVNIHLIDAQLLAVNSPHYEDNNDSWETEIKSLPLNLRIAQYKEKIQLELHKSEKGVVSFALYNNKMEQLYRQVLDINFTGNFTQILNMKNLNTGRYLLQVNKEKGEKVWKIIEFLKENDS